MKNKFGLFDLKGDNLSINNDLFLENFKLYKFQWKYKQNPINVCLKCFYPKIMCIETCCFLGNKRTTIKT